MRDRKKKYMTFKRTRVYIDEYIKWNDFLFCDYYKML